MSMMLHDNSDDSILVYHDWLLDHERDTEAQEILDEVFAGPVADNIYDYRVSYMRLLPGYEFRVGYYLDRIAVKVRVGSRDGPGHITHGGIGGQTRQNELDVQY